MKHRVYKLLTNSYSKIRARWRTNGWKVCGYSAKKSYLQQSLCLFGQFSFATF